MHSGGPERLQVRFFWPPLPDRPRIEWIHAYSSQLDLERTSSRFFKEALVGEDAPQLFIKPVDIRSDASRKKVYISDIGLPGIHVYDFADGEVRKILTAGDLRLFNPVGITLGPDGSLYVLEARSKTVHCFNSSEKYVKSIKLQGNLRRPVSILLDRSGKKFYVADPGTHQIAVFDMEGTRLTSIGGPGDEPGKFNVPVAMAFTSKGMLVVADSFNARIQVFTPEGSFVRAFGKRGDSPGDFQLIKGVAVDSEDNIYITDSKANSITIYSQEGTYLLMFGGFYMVNTGKIAPGGFALPLGIDIDSRDNIFIIDQLNTRFHHYRYLSDAYLKENPVEGIK